MTGIYLGCPLLLIHNFFSEIENAFYIAYDIDNVNTLTILAKANFINFLACIIFLNYDFK